MRLTGKEKLYLSLFIIFISISSIFFVYYSFYSNSNTQTVEDECMQLCVQALKNGTDLSNGPCLSEHLKTNPDWVCDVAHWPREAVDDNPENQCKSYGVTAKHFVEVSPDCRVIRKS